MKHGRRRWHSGTPRETGSTISREKRFHLFRGQRPANQKPEQRQRKKRIFQNVRCGRRQETGSGKTEAHLDAQVLRQGRGRLHHGRQDHRQHWPIPKSFMRSQRLRSELLRRHPRPPFPVGRFFCAVPHSRRTRALLGLCLHRRPGQGKGDLLRVRCRDLQRKTFVKGCFTICSYVKQVIYIFLFPNTMHTLMFLGFIIFNK